MTPRVLFLLAGVLLVLFCLDALWGAVVHASIDYGKLGHVALFSLLPLSVGIVYSTWRPDERVASVMFAVAFLLNFTPLCTLLNYLAIPLAGPRIDNMLAGWDRALGINWPGFIMAFAGHPLAVKLLGIAYKISAFQVAAAIALLGYRADVRGIAVVCIATVICALTTIAFWTALPSFGAYTIFDLSEIGRRSGLIIDRSYPDFLVRVLAHGPGRIDILNAKGLVGFPSFHTEELVIAWWTLRKQRLVFILISLFSLVALVSVPFQGGHHFVDILGGFGFAALGIWSAGKILKMLEGKVSGIQPAMASLPAGAAD
jgi:hypothetical protein